MPKTKNQPSVENKREPEAPGAASLMTLLETETKDDQVGLLTMKTRFELQPESWKALAGKTALVPLFRKEEHLRFHKE